MRKTEQAWVDDSLRLCTTQNAMYKWENKDNIFKDQKQKRTIDV